MGDQLHPEQLAGDSLGLVGPLHDLDAAAFAAPAGVNLRLDDGHGAAETPGNRAGTSGAVCHFAARHRHAVFRENRLALVFVNLHGVIVLPRDA